MHVTQCECACVSVLWMCTFTGICEDLCVRAFLLFPTHESDALLFFLARNSFCPQQHATRNVERERPYTLMLSFSIRLALYCLFLMKQSKHGCLGLASFPAGLANGSLRATRRTVLHEDSRQEAALPLSSFTLGSRHPVPTAY